LGWFRQCDAIPYSIDADIGIFAADFRPEILAAIEDEGLQLRMILGTPEDSYQMAFVSKEIKLDVYFFYPINSSHVFNSATKPETGEKFAYDFERFDLCWTEFLDLLIRVPCDTQKYIEANYGPNWFEPISNWEWNRSPPNVRPNGRWPESSWNQTIQIFFIK